jgi:hypothetical protein
VFASLVAALHHVPDVIWGALIAALVAFTSTALSNRNSRKQLQMQLASTALQQDRDRTMTLRRDVFLPATEALARLQGALGQLTSVKADQEAIAHQFVIDNATLAKVHLVASESTITALMAYQKAFMPAYLGLIELRGPLVNRQRAIDQEQAFMDAAIAEHQQIVQLMKEHNISGSADTARPDRLKLQGGNIMIRHKTHSETQAALWQEQIAAQLNIAEKLTEILARTTPLIPSALLSARQDVDLPINEYTYRRLYDEQQEAALSMMRGILQRARNPNPVKPPPAPPENHLT